MAFTSEQRGNAGTIIRVGQQMGMSSRDILIGLMTAMQESSLRNLRYGDRDSQGLFQQRPSQGWGTVAQVTDPVYASRKFFSALKGVKGRDRMALTQAAQAVQRSAFPDAYAKHEGGARSLLTSLSKGAGDLPDFSGLEALEKKVQGLEPLQETVRQNPLFRPDPAADAADRLQAKQSSAQELRSQSTEDLLMLDDDTKSEVLQIKEAGEGAKLVENPIQPMPSFSEDEFSQIVTGGTPQAVGGSETTTGGGGSASGVLGKVVAEAKKWIGTPYVWGGSGPLGFDCSGFTQYVMKQFGVNIPRVSYQQGQGGRGVSMKELQPGDLLFWDNSSRNPGADHVAIYIGGGQYIDAPRPGKSIGIRPLSNNPGAWARRYL